MTRTFPVLITEANQAKIAGFAAAVRPLHVVANDIVGYQLRELHLTGRAPRRLTVPHIDARGVSERYKYQAANAASGAFRSWLSNAENAALAALRQSTARGTDLYRAAVRITRFGYAVGPDRPLVNSKGENLLAGLEVGEVEARRLARHAMRRALATRRLPRFREGTWMNLDNKVAVLHEPTHATRFQLWLKAATIHKGRPVLIPIYVPMKLRGRIKAAKTVQARVVAGRVELRVVGEKMREAVDPSRKVEVLGLDTGAAVPIATSEGDLLGRKFWRRVQHLDKLIQRCAKGLHASGVTKPTESRRYRALVIKLRGYVTNEIRRYVKTLVHRYDPDEVVVEAHTFTQAPGLSRRMNRLLTRIGVGAFNRALADLSDEYGFTVTQVNPAYTSQECPSCHHAERANRDSRIFSCRQCGRTGHADVVGAVNIRNRRSAPGLHRLLGKTTWLGGKEHALRYVRSTCSSGRPSRRVESRPRAAGMAAVAEKRSLMSHDVPSSST